MSLTQQLVEDLAYEGESHRDKKGRRRWSQHVVWDDRVPGLGLRVSHTNRKTFVVVYRTDGRKRRKTLGTAKALTLAEARRLATELLESVDAAPAAAPAPPAPTLATVNDLADAWIRHLESHVPSSFVEQRMLRTHVRPAMGRTALTDLTPMEIDSLKRRVTQQFSADGRKLAKVIDELLRWAESQGLWAPGREARAALAEARKSVGSGTAPAEVTENTRTTVTEEVAADPPAEADERQELAARLGEVSAVGAEMMASLNEQAAARQRLEAELAKTRAELQKTRRQPGRARLAEAEQAAANLRETVEQLLEAQRQAKAESRELGAQLAAARESLSEQKSRLRTMAGERNELETRLLEAERHGAVRATRRLGRSTLLRRGGLVAVGALAGALLALLVAGRGVQAPVAPHAESPGDPSPAVAAAPEEAAPSPPREPAPRAAIDPAPPAAAAADEPVDPKGADEPAGPTGAEPAGDLPDMTAIEPAVRAWGAAWSEQRVPDYLAAYASGFEPPGGQSRADWEALRRERILRPASIQLEIGPLERTEIEPGRVRVAFPQRYSAGSYQDEVRKLLELVWEEGAWKITAERSE